MTYYPSVEEVIAAHARLPFVDGNKRVSIAVTAAFLWANGYLDAQGHIQF